MAQTTKRGRRMVSRHIRMHKREGMPQKQAIAAALSEARRKGCKVPPRRRARKATRKATKKRGSKKR